jgi:molybdate-binding protein
MQMRPGVGPRVRAGFVYLVVGRRRRAGLAVRRKRESGGVTGWRAHMEEELVERVRKGEEGVGDGGMRVGEGVTVAHCGC